MFKQESFSMLCMVCEFDCRLVCNNYTKDDEVHIQHEICTGFMCDDECDFMYWLLF